jgi:hypothetical protein
MQKEPLMPLDKCPHPHPDGRFRAWRGGRAYAGAAGMLAAIVVASAAVAGPQQAAWATTRGSSGSLVLKGFLSGTLKVPAFLPPGQILTGCQISPSQTGTVVLQWDSAKLKVNGQAKTLKNIDVQVTVAKFGHSYPMTLNSYGGTPASITFQSNMPFGWSSISGRLTTTKSGGAGSVSASMSAGKAHSGTVSISGNWAGCTNLG